MDPIVLITFLCVYAGMVLGYLPGLALDRTGVALVGAIVLLSTERVSMPEAWRAIDVTTIALLLGLMVVSAQFRIAGFYAFITRRIAGARMSPQALLAVLIAVTAFLSAILANDIVCLAVAPVLVESCARRKLNPEPFLLSLACASNVGSAATLIGNPQNMLIGQRLNLSFSQYMLTALPPTLIGLVAVWGVAALLYRGQWTRECPAHIAAAPALNPWQCGKGVLVTIILMALFLFAPVPRDVVAMGAAGILLMSRKMATRHILGFVDWHLLVLFAGLFVVNHCVETSGLLGILMDDIRKTGIEPRAPGWLFALSVVLSNIVSNVPATMLLLPVATHPTAGAVLALSSTLAGNLIIVGSIANIIVVDQAQRMGVTIGWRTHAKMGIPVTIITLAIAAAWLLLAA